MYVCMYVCMYSVYTYIYIYMYMYIDMCVYMHMYIGLRAYPATPPPPSALAPSRFLLFVWLIQGKLNTLKGVQYTVYRGCLGDRYIQNQTTGRSAAVLFQSLASSCQQRPQKQRRPQNPKQS